LYGAYAIGQSVRHTRMSLQGQLRLLYIIFVYAEIRILCAIASASASDRREMTVMQARAILPLGCPGDQRNPEQRSVLVGVAVQCRFPVSEVSRHAQAWL